MIQWCQKCETNPIKSTDVFFYIDGVCFPCVAKGVGHALDRAVLYGMPEETAIPPCFIKPINPQPYTLESLFSLRDWRGKDVRPWGGQSFKWTITIGDAEDHIIRSEN